MRIGTYELHSLNTGLLWLDGGAMFGVVPRVLWEKRLPADDLHRVRMSMNVLLVRGPGVNLLVDTGVGEKEEASFFQRFSLGPWGLPEALARHGLASADITHVFNTHLHFDHAGGNTGRDAAGKIVPSFPNARYMVQGKEYRDATHPNERNRASYFGDNYVPLRDSGQMELLEGEAEVAPGLWAYPLPGHTEGMQGLLVASGGPPGLYLADCVPTAHHLPLPWVMAYDLFPLTTMETKSRVLPQAATEGWTLFFEHDADTPAARIRQGKPGRFEVEPVDVWG